MPKLTLYIFRQVSNNQIVGFGIFNNFELKLLPDDERNENKYIAVNGFGCISKEARGKSLQRNFFTYRAWSDTEYFPNRNVLMIDVCINPLSYLEMCQSTKVLFPRYNVRTPEGIEKLLAQTMQIAEYERFEDNDNPFLVKDPFQASEDLTGKFRKNQENLHEDIKFYQVTELGKIRELPLLLLFLWLMVILWDFLGASILQKHLRVLIIRNMTLISQKFKIFR
jgi:hypothetical protein